MSGGVDSLVARATSVRGGDVAAALVGVWAICRGAAANQPRPRDLEHQSDALVRALERGDPPPSIHPLGALRALDRLLRRERAGRQLRLIPVDHEGKSYVIAPRPAGWTSKLSSEQAGHVEFWMREHQIVPAEHRGLTITLSPATSRRLRRLGGESLRFLVASVPDGVCPDWDDGACTALLDPATRLAGVLSTLDGARTQGAHVVLLPELTVDGTVRQGLRSWLREHGRETSLALVVAGSFHEGTGSERRNVAYCYDHIGNEILRHAKIRPIDVQKPATATRGAVALFERIQGGTHVSALATERGLVVMPICLDYCETGDRPVKELWTRIGPALALVPAMGERSTNSAHRTRAVELARQHGTVTLVATQHPENTAGWALCWSPTDGPDPADLDAAPPQLAGEAVWLAE